MSVNPVQKGLQAVLSFFGRILYTAPKRYWIKIKRRGFKKFIQKDLLGSTDSPEKKALSIMLGVFVGLIPLYGFQTLLVIFLALYFKLNKVIAIAFSYISIPPLIPFIIFIEFKTGQWILNNASETSLYKAGGTLNITENLGTFITGSLIVSIGVSVVLGGLGYLLFQLINKKAAIPETSS